MDIERLKTRIDRIGFEIEQKNLRKNELLEEKDCLGGMSKNIDEAIEILTAVLAGTQEGVVKFIEETVTTALQYVYGDNYGFEVEYVLKRDQPEVILRPTKGEMVYDPKFTGGIGVVDVCSFALRYVCWALMEERSASIMFHDEPFKFVHGKEENLRLGEMVKNMSDLLGLQVILVSGESALINSADKAFKVTMENDISQVEMVDNA